MNTPADPPEDFADDVRRRLLRKLSLAPLGGGLSAAGVRLLQPAWPLLPAFRILPALPLTVGLPDRSLAATPACDRHPQATPRQTEGPYFTRDSPQRRSLLEDGVSGTRLVLTGQVRSLDCAALSGVLLDFWQADADGRYHNRDYRLRGHQFTDGEGRYRLETVVPGLYPGRTRHLHVKVQAPGGPVLTTQLYFAGEARNGADAIFSEALLMSAGSTGPAAGPPGTVQAGFDFAIRAA